MKKIVAVILCVSVIFSSVSFFCFADSKTELKFAVASDIHYAPGEETLEKTNDDKLFWYANRRGEMSNESDQIIDAFLRDVAQSDMEYVLISGDIANKGKSCRKDHEYMAQKLERFERESGKTVFVIDGNHDIVEKKSDTDVNKAEFKEIYKNLGYDKAIDCDDKTISYTADMGDRYRLIAVDTCDEKQSTGDGVTSALVSWVCRMAQKAKKDNREPVVMMHHNLLNALPLESIISKNFIVPMHETVATLFADNGIRLVFSGHSHNSSVSSFISQSGNTVYDFCTTSLIMYPIQYRAVTLDKDGKCSYEAKNIEKIDVQKVNSSVNGYTAEMLEFMKNDFTEYSKQYFKAAIRHRLLLSLSMEKMGIKETDIYFNLVNTAVSRLQEMLEMNLYGENSLQELAKKYKIDIVTSDYKNGWDVATEIVASFYAGGGEMGMDSVEVKILLNILNLVLKDDLSLVGDRTILKYVNKVLGTDGLLGDLTKSICRKFGAVTPAEKFLVTLVSPLIYDFLNDVDGAADNNGALDENAVSKNDKVWNILKGTQIATWIKNVFLKIVNFVKSLFSMFGVKK